MGRLATSKGDQAECGCITNPCPICGHTAAARKCYTNSLVRAPYGPEVPYTAVSHECELCHEAWACEQNDSDTLAALAVSRHRAAGAIIKFLRESGRKDAYIERTFGLAFGSLARWESGELSAESFGLLVCLRHTPELVEQIDNNQETH